MSYENITLEKGMYNVKGGITAALESIDPSENYIDTPLEGLDAYQRQLKRFDIKVSGPGSDTVEKFFGTTSSAALFPEYLTRAVHTGMVESNLLSEIVATTTHINGMDYRSIASVPTDAEKELREVTEGTAIPETAVHTKETLVELKKRGRMLVASYEALRFQRLDLFTVTLKQIGAHIASQQFNDAITVLSTGAGAVTPSVASSFAYSDLVSAWSTLSPYDMNTVILSPDIIKRMLTLEVFQDPDFGITLGGGSVFDTSLGFKLINAKGKTLTALAFDKNYALEMVVASDVQVDSDRLIDKQLERAAITSIAGFSKIIADAVKSITYTAK